MHFVWTCNFNKNGTESKMENFTHSFRETNLCFSSYKNQTLKLWWVGACERKKRAFFVPFILSKGIFLNICLLSRFIVYWIYSQNIHTFTYQKNIASYTFKIVASLQCILKYRRYYRCTQKEFVKIVKLKKLGEYHDLYV